MTKITISNRNNSAFEVTGKKPLLNELRDQGVDLPYGCQYGGCLLYTSPSPRDAHESRMPSSA